MRRVSLAAVAVLLFAGMAFAQDVTPLDLDGDIANGAVVAEGCMGCHGDDGHTSRTNTPHLAGQYEDYLKAELWKFKTEQRVHGSMNRVAGGLDVQEIADVAAYWADQPAQGEPWDVPNEMLVRLGGEFYATGGGGVSACARCHGVEGEGNPDRNIPRVWGLGPDYVANALDRYRAGSETPTSMHRVASRLTDADVEVLRAFLASQPWGQESSAAAE